MFLRIHTRVRCLFIVYMAAWLSRAPVKSSTYRCLAAASLWRSIHSETLMSKLSFGYDTLRGAQDLVGSNTATTHHLRSVACLVSCYIGHGPLPIFSRLFPVRCLTCQNASFLVFQRSPSQSLLRDLLPLSLLDLLYSSKKPCSTRLLKSLSVSLIAIQNLVVLIRQIGPQVLIATPYMHGCRTLT